MSEEERWLVVNGRRWAREDPHIPDKLAAELRSELMAARRAIKTGDEGARARVQAAKVALGERGPRWWDARTDRGVATRASATIDALLGHRGPEKSICPSDVAKVVDGQHWRSRMDQVRDVIADRARAGDVVVTQAGRELDPHGSWRGPVRVRASNANLRAKVRAERDAP